MPGNELSSLQAVAGACSHLPMYEAQQLHAHIKGFKEQLLQLRAQGAPKKRFSFARKPAHAKAVGGELGKPGAAAPGSKACKEEAAQRPVSNAQASAISLENSREASETSRSSAAAAVPADDRERYGVSRVLLSTAIIQWLQACEVCVRIADCTWPAVLSEMQ